MANDNIFYSGTNPDRESVIESQKKINVSRSVFPYGKTNTYAMNEGQLYVSDCFFVIPGDSLDIDMVTNISQLNPFVDRMFSGARVYHHWYYQKCEHEWKGWKNYSTRGRRGNISLKLPYVDLGEPYPVNFDGHLFKVDPGASTPAFKPYLCSIHDVSSSLAATLTRWIPFGCVNQIMPTDFLTDYYNLHVSGGTRPLADILRDFRLDSNTQVNRPFRLALWDTFFNPSVRPSSGTTGSEDVHKLTSTTYQNSLLNAIPFSMFQRCYRDFYSPKDLFRNNKNWFPDDEDDFCLPYSGGVVYTLHSEPVAGQTRIYSYSEVPNNFSKYPTTSYSTTSSDYLENADDPVLVGARCRQWDGDIFTTAKPFLERNGDTTLFSTIKAFNGVSTSFDSFSGVHQLNDFTLTPAPTPPNYKVLGVNIPSNGDYFQDVYRFPNYDLTNSEGRVGLRSLLTLNQFRELAAATAWSEKNARVDGSYNSLIRVHYGVNPKSEDRSATYIGGTVQRLTFSEILQTSESANTPLGSQASRAYSASSGQIGHFEVPDFGYVMCISSLVPDTYYTQGLSPDFDPELTGSDLPWPEFANLQKEPLPYKRIFYSGYLSGSIQSNGNDTMGYIERDLFYKSRHNTLSGHLLDFMDSKFKSLTFARYFSAYNNHFTSSPVPQLNSEFTSMSYYSMRSDMYSVPSQPHYIIQFADNVRLVRALPFVSQDSNLTNII